MKPAGSPQAAILAVAMAGAIFLTPLLQWPPLVQAQESRTQEVRDFYDRWIGAEAPEFGGAMRDRLMGETIKLEDLRGNRVLLYGFDSGNFVDGPSEGVFPENLRVLEGVGGEIGSDRLAVIGYTEGVSLFMPFFKPGTEVPEELGRLSRFPLINSLPLRHRSRNEPFNLLGRPGGMVLDRNGIIIAIHTEAMTEDQIRQAATLPDWNGKPRPAPTEDRWDGKGPPKPQMTPRKLWAKRLDGVVGLTSGDWNLDGTPDLIVATSDRRIVVLESSGREVAGVAVDAFSGRVPVTIEWAEHKPGESALLVVPSGWPQHVSIVATDGRVLWTYPATRIDGVDSATWVDIDGDGTSELAIGFNADGGLHLVSNTGDLLWENHDAGNRWVVAGIDGSSSLSGRVLSSGADGAVRIYDPKGSSLQTIGSRDNCITEFGVVPGGPKVPAQLLYIQNPRVGSIAAVVATDLTKKQRWRYPIHQVGGARVPRTIVAGDLTGDGMDEWVVISGANEISILNFDGQLVANVPFSPKGGRFLAVLPRADGTGVIVLADGEGVTAYTLRSFERKDPG